MHTGNNIKVSNTTLNWLNCHDELTKFSNALFNAYKLRYGDNSDTDKCMSALQPVFDFVETEIKDSIVADLWDTNNTTI